MIFVGVPAGTDRAGAIDQNVRQRRRRKRSQQPSTQSQEVLAAIAARAPFKRHVLIFRGPTLATLIEHRKMTARYQIKFGTSSEILSVDVRYAPIGGAESVYLDEPA